MPTRPRVLFVCVKNGGKSQMAAALMKQTAGEAIDVDSAGTQPGTAINALSAQVLLEVGLDISANVPKLATDEVIQQADVVVVLGREATLEPGDGPPVLIWDTDEPSERGIDGIERMRLVRDDIGSRVKQLANALRSDPEHR
jgi:arsenate-mycothiol transferase